MDGGKEAQISGSASWRPISSVSDTQEVRPLSARPREHNVVISEARREDDIDDFRNAPQVDPPSPYGCRRV